MKQTITNNQTCSGIYYLINARANLPFENFIMNPYIVKLKEILLKKFWEFTRHSFSI